MERNEMNVLKNRYRTKRDVGETSCNRNVNETNRERNETVNGTNRLGKRNVNETKRERNETLTKRNVNETDAYMHIVIENRRNESVLVPVRVALTSVFDVCRILVEECEFSH